MDGKETCGKAGPDRRRAKPIAAPTAGWWWSGSIAPCSRLQTRYLPQSPMGQAISYALNQWATLQRFLDHGEVEIDNNLVENAIRPDRHRQEELALFRIGRSGPAQRGDLHLDRELPDARRRTLYLPQRRAGALAHHDQPASSPTDAAQLEERASVANQNGRLILTRRQANRSSYHNPPTSTGGRSFTAYHCGGSKSSFTMR